MEKVIRMDHWEWKTFEISPLKVVPLCKTMWNIKSKALDKWNTEIHNLRTLFSALSGSVDVSYYFCVTFYFSSLSCKYRSTLSIQHTKKRKAKARARAELGKEKSRQRKAENSQATHEPKNDCRYILLTIFIHIINIFAWKDTSTT